jgi:hypothetical protein
MVKEALRTIPSRLRWDYGIRAPREDNNLA